MPGELTTVEKAAILSLQALAREWQETTLSHSPLEYIKVIQGRGQMRAELKNRKKAKQH